MKVSKLVEYHNVFTRPYEKSKIASFASSIIKNIVVFQSKFPENDFGLELDICCLFKSVAVNRDNLVNNFVFIATFD